MPAPATDTDNDNDISLDVIGLAAGRLGVKLPHDPSTASPTAKPAAGKSGAAAPTVDDDDGTDPQGSETETPAREEGETDEDYAARLEDAGLDQDQIDAALEASAAAAETDEERAVRLQQQDGETDEDYEARLEAEGLTRDDVPAAEAPPEPSEEEKRAAAAKARDEADLKKLPEPVRKTVQAILDKRIGRITAKTAAEKQALEQRAAQLESELAEAKEAAKGQPARATVVEKVHPLLLDPSEDAIGKYLGDVEKFEDWAADHEDGYEPSAEEIAQGYQPATKAEIRQRLRALQRERDKLVPQAREILTQRATADAEARKLLPAFFDATKPEYQAARTLLREQPELKRFPDYMTRAAEIVLGRKALAALRAGKTKKPITPPARAPRAPGGGSARGGFAERKPVGTDASQAVKSFLKAPSRENLAAAAGSFLGTT